MLGMAGGWTCEGAVLRQIDDTILDGVLTARGRMSAREGCDECVECRAPIPEARRRALRGVWKPCLSDRNSRVVVAEIDRRDAKAGPLHRP